MSYIRTFSLVALAMVMSTSCKSIETTSSDVLAAGGQPGSNASGQSVIVRGYNVKVLDVGAHMRLTFERVVPEDQGTPWNKVYFVPKGEGRAAKCGALAVLATSESGAPKEFSLSFKKFPIHAGGRLVNPTIDDDITLPSGVLNNCAAADRSGDRLAKGIQVQPRAKGATTTVVLLQDVNLIRVQSNGNMVYGVSQVEDSRPGNDYYYDFNPEASGKFLASFDEMVDACTMPVMKRAFGIKNAGLSLKVKSQAIGVSAQGLYEVRGTGSILDCSLHLPRDRRPDKPHNSYCSYYGTKNSCETNLRCDWLPQFNLCRFDEDHPVIQSPQCNGRTNRVACESDIRCDWVDGADACFGDRQRPF